MKSQIWASAAESPIGTLVFVFEHEICCGLEVVNSERGEEEDERKQRKKTNLH